MEALSPGFSQEKIILLELCGKQTKVKQQPSSERQQTGQTETNGGHFPGSLLKAGSTKDSRAENQERRAQMEVGVRTRENSGPGSQCLDRRVADRVPYSSTTD